MGRADCTARNGKSKMPTFNDIITVEDEDGDEFDITVTIDYDVVRADPSVGIMQGYIENIGFTKSDDPVFNVKWLTEKLNNNSFFRDYVDNIVNEKAVSHAEAAEDYDDRYSYDSN